MESQLKQRLVGAAVLVALAVIFLPMLVKGPAPDSGVSDVPLQVPDAPQGEYETRDLPLVVPQDVPEGGATGMPTTADDGDTLPTVDTATASAGGDAANEDAADLAEPARMLPATAAGGGYAVHFGTYASSVDADTVVSRLRGAELPARREDGLVDGRQVWRVRIGPYASRADAEIARIEAAKAGGQSGARVIALDAGAASVAQPAPEKAAAEPDEPPAQPVAGKPAEKPAAAPKPTAPPAAAPAVGFAVQVGAFGNAAHAGSKRDELRAAGFSAFTETVNTGQGTLTRVLAGPVVSRADADRLKAQIKARLGIDGLVRAHP